EKICKMKQTAYLINLARASIIDRDGFIKAMKEHKIAGAALDVFWSEPMELNDEIYSLDNVYMTPHIATSTIETRTRNILEVTRSIKKVALGEKPDYCVNM
ncbi:MAG: NAD(P)-dependent oxidoreductase, partial [Thermodesulfobacteriota bacterium]|nr:NAD(P)-dependent oxidoreductase [Thermodesulfobacteriota bacterium]